MRQARGGVSRAGRRRGGQGGGCDGGGDEAPSCAVSPQGGRRDGRTVQSHAADPALDLLGPQLCVLLLLLDQSGFKRRGLERNGEGRGLKHLDDMITLKYFIDNNIVCPTLNESEQT